jgi:hypothetical protein
MFCVDRTFLSAAVDFEVDFAFDFFRTENIREGAPILARSVRKSGTPQNRPSWDLCSR